MKDTKIYLIAENVEVLDELDLPTGKKELIVSHGIGNDTLMVYVLPNQPLKEFLPKSDDVGFFISAT